MSDVVSAMLVAAVVGGVMLAANRLAAALDRVREPPPAPLPPWKVTLVAYRVAGWYRIEVEGRSDVEGLVDEVLLLGEPYLRVRVPDEADGFEPGDRLVSRRVLARLTEVAEPDARRRAAVRRSWLPGSTAPPPSDRGDRAAIDVGGLRPSGLTEGRGDAGEERATAVEGTVACG